MQNGVKLKPLTPFFLYKYLFCSYVSRQFLPGMNTEKFSAPISIFHIPYIGPVA